jgi:hypothetical protein
MHRCVMGALSDLSDMLDVSDLSDGSDGWPIPEPPKPHATFYFSSSVGSGLPLVSGAQKSVAIPTK